MRFHRAKSREMSPVRHIIVLRCVPVSRSEKAVVLSDDFGVKVSGEFGIVFGEILNT